jgi:hypothetical protein
VIAAPGQLIAEQYLDREISDGMVVAISQDYPLIFVAGKSIAQELRS